MYYVIKSSYVGPNPQQHLNADTIGIYTVPGRTNSSREIRTDGWLGTTNDWSEHAHGEFETIEDARAEIMSMGPCRPADSEWAESDYDQNEMGCVELYSEGQYEALNAEESAQWCYYGRSNITAETTDDEIVEMVDDDENFANGEGLTLDLDAVMKMYTSRRDELLAEIEDAAE
jgi:hypothetical protein